MIKRILLSCIAIGMLVTSLCAQGLLVTGIVKDKESRKVLANVNVAVEGSNVGTVTNADGVFSLKVSEEELGRGVIVSHLGYQNEFVSSDILTQSSKRSTILLTPTSITLDMLHVYGGNPLALVEQALRKIPQNYSANDHLFSAFYRETIQKGKRYIGVSEAVLDVYKTDYKVRDISHDRVQIHRGRRLQSQKRSDTLAVKIAGGPNMPIYLDVAKNGDELLNVNMLPCYRFSMQISMSIDDHMQYVVAFEPRVVLDHPLYRGLLYIDQQTLSITRAEFQLDMSDKEKSARFILRKKPQGLRFKLQEVSYLVTYRYQDGKSYLNYLRNSIRFKCDWKKRLFSSTFTTHTEMVMVDRKDHPEERIRLKDAFGQREVFYDVVEVYWNEDFWKDYNIIEPSESLESAVKKLKKQNK